MADNINLKNILREEKKDKLSPIDNDFYIKAHKHIRELEVEKNKTKPDSIKHRMARTEFDAARVNFELIIELRMSKIINEASTQKSLIFAEKHEPEHMTPDERELYDALYNLMSEWRNKHLNPAPDKAKEETPQAAAPVTAKTPAAPKDISKDYIVVRMLADVPTFIGMDKRNYTLSKEDVATIPAVNASALILRRAAVRIGV